VLALARRRLDAVLEDPDPAVAELDLLGFVGLKDPVRATAQASVAQAREAGITLLMATGDHPATAGAVAAEVGMANGDDVTTGRQLRVDGLADDPTSVPVYARVDPDQKLALVGRLQERGQVVGMGRASGCSRGVRR
jgi:magnesium-transporting ATPase (P-type)